MGLFSSKIRTYVGTSVSRLNDSTKYEPSHNIAVIKSIARNESVSEHIMDELINNTAFKAKRYFNSASRSYVHGIPKDTTTTKTGLNSVITINVSAHLSTLEGETITPEYVFYGPSNYFHFGWKEIYATYAYEPSTDELVNLSTVKGHTVTLTAVNLLAETALIDAVASDCFYSLGFAGTVKNVSGRTTVGLEIEYEWTVPPVFPAVVGTTYTETVVVTEDLDIGIVNGDYYQAQYSLPSTGVDKFFEYVVGSGVLPLDSPLGFEYDAPGTYYPWLYFRYNFTEPVVGTQEYIDSVRLCKKMGMKYASIVERIHKVDTDPSLPLDEQRSQADLDQVISSFMYLAVTADGTEQVEKQYLFRYFAKHFISSGGTTTSLSLNDFNASFSLGLLNDSAIIIRDARFKIVLSNRGMFKRTVTGAIGAINTYGSDKGHITVSEDFGEGYIHQYTYAYHVFRKQTTTTEYEEYQVIDLTAKYNVSEDYYATSGWTEDVTDPKDILLIPLDKELVDDLTAYDAEQLCYLSTQIVNNSLVRVKVKWYQKSWFSTLMKILAIIAILNGFYQGFQFFEALLAVASVSVAWAIELALTYLINLLYRYIAIKIFVNIVGEEATLILAAIAAIMGFTKTGVETQYFTLSPKELLTLSGVLMKQISAETTEKFQDLQAEMNAFSKEATEKFNEIDKILKELDKPHTLGNILIGESAEDFYNRTIRLGNVGTRLYELQSNYVEAALQLPEPQYEVNYA